MCLSSSRKMYQNTAMMMGDRRTSGLFLLLLTMVIGNLVSTVLADSASTNLYSKHQPPTTTTTKKTLNLNRHHYHHNHHHHHHDDGQKRCDLETFQLYDGYVFVSNNNNNENKKNQSNLYQCLDDCRKRPICFGINYNGFDCEIIDEQQYQSSSVSEPRLIRSGSNSTSNGFNTFAKKICLNTNNRMMLQPISYDCGLKPWAFETVIGWRISQDSTLETMIKPNVPTVRQCAELCLNWPDFVCRSALYNQTNQQCTLCNMNRQTIATDSSMESARGRPRFVPVEDRESKSNIYYIENKCIPEPRSFCDFKKIKKFRLKSMDWIETGFESHSECRELCLTGTRPCKSYHFDRTSRQCSGSHLSEASTNHMLEPYAFDEEAVTFEISTCYNVTVSCQSKSMRIQIETSKMFNGKIYAQSQPRTCVNDVINELNFELSVPYSSTGYNQNHCGTRQSTPGRFSNDIIIQHHDLVLTTKDLALGVYCKFDLHNASVAQVDLKIQGDVSTDKLKGTAKLPELSLHIVDQNGNDLDEVSVGDMIRVQIRMSDEDTYGIFVRNLLAKDSQNPNNNFTLIDSKGCPSQMRMMREVRLLDGENGNGKALESYLEAFTFTGGTYLIIQVEVETCLDKCKPVQCQVTNGRSFQGVETVISYGKRRRRRRRRKRWTTRTSLFNNDDDADAIYEDQEDDHDGDDGVISMTKLTKSLVIRGQSQPIPPPPPPIRDTPESETSALHRSGSSRRMPKDSDSGSGLYRILSITNKNFVCFEPNILLVLCAGFCLIQISLFSLVFCLIIRMKNAQCKREQGQFLTSTTLPTNNAPTANINSTMGNNGRTLFQCSNMRYNFMG